MRPKSYRELVHSLGLEYCRGIYRGRYCTRDHNVGEAEAGIVHFGDRRMSWPGIHRVLKLAVAALVPGLDEKAPWERVYLLNQGARKLGQGVHLRVPSRYIEYDRAFVRAGVANLGNDVPLRREAFDWSRR